MRVVIPLIALLLTTGAGGPQTVPGQAASEGLLAAPAGQAPPTVCRDTIQQVRRELGKPPLERSAAPADPLLIAAVDRRIDGCSVMVVLNDTSDIRPLPAPQEHRLMPAK